MKIQQFFTIVSIAIIFAFVFVFGLFIFNKIFFGKDFGYIDNAIGAFMGAFFAFLFIRVSDIFSRIYERQRQNHNSLVKLEHACIEYGNVISDNIFIIKDFLTLASTAIKEKKPFVYFNRLHEISIVREIVFNLSNIDLINNVSSFYIHMDKMNSSMSSSNRMYEEIKDAFIQKNITPENYLENIIILMEKFKELKLFLGDLTEENIRIAATARVLLRERPLLVQWTQFFSRKYFTKKEKEFIPKEISIIKSQITEIQSKSRERIDRIRRDND